MSAAGSGRGDRVLGAVLGGAIGAAPGVVLLLVGDAIGGGGGTVLRAIAALLAAAGLIDGLLLGAQRGGHWRARAIPPVVWTMGAAFAVVVAALALRAFG